MTEEEIKQKATETYSEHEFGIYVKDNELKREGYTKALTELEFMPKIKGWVARDKPGYGNSRGWLRLHFREPEKTVRDWDSKDEFNVDDSQILKDDMFPDLTWESEPLKVELIIRKS